MPRTISLYERTISFFNSEYDEPTIENINKFVTDSFRINRSYYMKYAFRTYLEYLGRAEEYTKIVKIKTKPAKREGCYLSNSEIINIILGIDDEKFMHVALAQFLTGGRSHDVLGFSPTEETLVINKDFSLTMRLFPKGERRYHYTRIPERYTRTFLTFFEKHNDKYPFLVGDTSNLVRAVDTNYRYYGEALKQAAIRSGNPSFRTHDFRRNYIDDVYKVTQDIRKTASSVGISVQTAMKYIQKKVDEKDVVDIQKQVRR